MLSSIKEKEEGREEGRGKQRKLIVKLSRYYITYLTCIFRFINLLIDRNTSHFKNAKKENI